MGNTGVDGGTTLTTFVEYTCLLTSADSVIVRFHASGNAFHMSRAGLKEAG
jgi:hypothetical protein